MVASPTDPMSPWGMAHYRKPGWFTVHVFNHLVALVARLGLSIWGARVLRVQGRLTGQWRSNPVNLLTLGGQRYLVGVRGETEWVRNLRAAGAGELSLGRATEPFVAEEVKDPDKTDILRAYLRRWRAETGLFFDGVRAESPDEELRRIAPEHPVFRIEAP